MTGAWVSGGIEWCVLHHHRASTLLPVDYSLEENENGSKTIWIGETEPRHRMRWTIGITVTPGKSYFEAEVKIANPTQYTNTFLFWANVAAHTNKITRYSFHPVCSLQHSMQRTALHAGPIQLRCMQVRILQKALILAGGKMLKAVLHFLHTI